MPRCCLAIALQLLHLPLQNRGMQRLCLTLSILLALSIGSSGVVAADSSNAAERRWQNLADTTFQHLTLEHGLPHEMVMSLVEDAEGFVWMGTQSGLGRWDGYRFRVYRHDPQDPNSLHDEHIRILHKDQRGRLWIGGDSGGLARYDAQTDQFVRIPVGEQGISNASVLSIIDDGDGGLWVGSKGGLDHLSAEGRRLAHFDLVAEMANKQDQNRPAAMVYSLLLDQQKRLWIGSNQGLARMQDGKISGIHMAKQNGANPLIRSLSQSKDGRIWIGTNGLGVYLIEPGSDLAQQVQSKGDTTLSYNTINFIREIDAEQVWIGTMTRGIAILNPRTFHVKRLLNEPSLPHSLHNNTARSLLQDRAGLIWIGTQRGVSRHNPNNAAIQTMFGGTQRSHALQDSDVTALTQMSDGKIWLGMQSQGLHIIDAKANTMQWHPAKLGHVEQGLPSSTLQVILEQSDGSVLIATDQGMYRSDLQASQFTHLHCAPRDPQNVISAMLQDGEHVWIGGTDGIWRIHARQCAPAQRIAGSKALDNERVMALLRGNQGEIWIGTRNRGLFRYDLASQSLQNYQPDDKDARSISSKNIVSLLHDSKGRLWVGTQGAGISILTKFDARSGKAEFTHVQSAQKLPNNMVNKLLADAQGNIWASTDAGLAVVHPETLAVRPLQNAEGVALNAYWANIGTQTTQGELLFGGAGGLTIAHPAQLKPWSYQPPLLITNLQLASKNIAVGKFNAKQQANMAVLEIPANANHLAVEFAALEYSAPERSHYAYRLEGYDQDWIASDASRRLASYSNLPPGEYQLRLRASNRDGVWNQAETILKIRVLPSLLQTWWMRLFIASLALSGLGIFIVCLVRKRTRALRRNQLSLEREVQQRTLELEQKQTELVSSNQELQESNQHLNSAIHSLAQSVDTLRQLGEIGRSITAKLDTKSVFESLFQAVDSLLSASSLEIYQFTAGMQSLELVFGHLDAQTIRGRSMEIASNDEVLQQVLKDRREKLFDLPLIAHSPLFKPEQGMQSALLAPLLVDDQLFGLILIQSRQRFAYAEREQLIFATLSAYAAIALDNAQSMAALHHAQSQLVQQEKLASLGGLVAGISHEINTPLGNTLVAISGVAESWQRLQAALNQGQVNRSLLTSCIEEGSEYTDLAMRTAERTADLISMFKTIAVKNDSDLSETQDLALYLNEIATLIKTPLEKAGNKLEIVVPEGIQMHLVFDALAEVLTRVFANVLDHAFANERRGMVRLTAHPCADGEVLITVADDGLGIAAHDLPYVFDPFFTTKSGLQGHVGLGLHVAYNHVTQRLKGKIDIASTWGEGTKVQIRIRSLAGR